MLLFGLRPFDKAEEELREVADDNEGWSQCWATVVLYDQVVSLELPENVRVALHHLEGVAKNGGTKSRLLALIKSECVILLIYSIFLNV